MYDLVVIGQGLTGLLAAIRGKEEGLNVALVASGTGKIMQSTGLFDLLPGKCATYAEFASRHQLNPSVRIQTEKAVDHFKGLMKRTEYPYGGDINKPVQVMTGSGYTKSTALYPETIHPIPNQGSIVVIGFKEIVDFSPKYIKGNLEKQYPELHIDTLSVSFGKTAGRTLTQLDAAKLLDQRNIRRALMKEIKKELARKDIKKADVFVFPASLGFISWKEVLDEWKTELGAPITEAPGMPPNGTAVRLFEVLRKEAIRLGVRFYLDTQVIGSRIENDRIHAVKIQNASNQNELAGENYIIATGGILGGGLNYTSAGYQETALRLAVDEEGRYINCPENAYPVGAALGTYSTDYGITGGVYSLLSCYEAIEKIQQKSLGGVQNA